MPSANTLLSGLVAILIAAGGGFITGREWQRGRTAEQIVVQQAETIEQAQQTVAADAALASRRVERNAAAETAARNVLSQGVSDANLKARPDCRRDADSLGLLVDAVAVANRPGAD